jgi:hypothetical protein
MMNIVLIIIGNHLKLPAKSKQCFLILQIISKNPGYF